MKGVNIIHRFLTYFAVLAPYSEIVGNLSKIENKGDTLAIVFSFDKEIELPESTINQDTLNKLIGERVGIFNCGDGRFKIRKISRKNP